MDTFKIFLDFANKQTNLGFGLVALLTAGGEQIFSSAVFSCPCNDLNFVYGMVFLLVPALALLLLGYILNKKTWKLLTGLCQRKASQCHCRKLVTGCTVLFQISTAALVAPSSWIAVALLHGNYFECAMTGINSSAYTISLCGDKDSIIQCQQQLYRFPCGTAINVPAADRNDVLLKLGAQSQIIGWLLIASIILLYLLLNCVARCTSPISYLQLKFWRAYVQEENNQFDSFITQHAKELAERNLNSFFNQTPPKEIITPTSKDWEKISSIYKYSTKDQCYSTLHRHVENFEVTDGGMMRMASVKSSSSAYTPSALDFVDNGAGMC